MTNSLETAAILLNETLAIREKLIQTAEQLLKDTSVIRKSCEERYREEGTAYNVFKAADISEREVPMCNILHDLLNPKGLHYRKSVYLERFMDMVVIPHIKKAVGLDLSKEFKLSKAEVIRECPTDKGKRIDIVISDKKVFIPIEAKIGTPDSQKQLTDYATFSKTMNPSNLPIPVLFLTRGGHKSEKARENKEYVPISFERDIVSWLEACLEKTEKVEPVKEIITQYIKAIKSFCGIMEDNEMAKKVIDLIIDSDDNYEAALKIRDAVQELINLDFDKKLREIFKDQILKRVKKMFPNHDAKKYTDDRLWIVVELNNGLTFSVTSDVKTFVVEKADPRKKVDSTKKKEIHEKMSGLLPDEFNEKENKIWKGIWASTNGRHPDIIEEKNDDMYMYKLYQIYLKKPQSVANWIVSIAKELENI
jgi:hypothetical protein